MSHNPKQSNWNIMLILLVFIADSLSMVGLTQLPQLAIRGTLSISMYYALPIVIPFIVCFILIGLIRTFLASRLVSRDCATLATAITSIACILSSSTFTGHWCDEMLAFSLASNIMEQGNIPALTRWFADLANQAGNGGLVETQIKNIPPEVAKILPPTYQGPVAAARVSGQTLNCLDVYIGGGVYGLGIEIVAEGRPEGLAKRSLVRVPVTRQISCYISD